MNSTCITLRRTIITGLSVFLLLGLFACGSGAPGPGTTSSSTGDQGSTAPSMNKDQSSDVAIRVNDKTVSMQEFNQRVNQRLNRLKQRMKKLPAKQRKQYMKRFRSRIEQQIANRMATQLVLESKVEQANIQVSDTEVEQELDRIAKQRFPDRKSLEKALEKQGRSLDQVKERIRTQMKIQRYIQSNIPEDTVSEQEAREYFQKNRSQYDKPEKVHARHILVKNDTQAQAKIERINKRLEAGEDFATVAREESEGPSARRGGDLGYFARDRMADSFSRVAFNTPIGEISDPVKTRFGYHIIKVEGKREAKKASFEDVQDTVVQRVRKKNRRQKIQQLIKKLRREADITMNVGKPPARPKSAPKPMKPGS